MHCNSRHTQTLTLDELLEFEPINHPVVVYFFCIYFILVINVAQCFMLYSNHHSRHF